MQRRTPSRIAATPAAAHRRTKVCPLCGEKNFSRLSHHLTNVHHLDRQEIQALIAYTDQNNNNNNNHPHTSMATVSSSSPTHLPPSMVADKSPQQTPISINTNNQQITSPLSSVSESDHLRKNSLTITPANLTSSSSPSDQQLSNYLPIDGKKRLLCPRCDTWVLNLTDHLIKKHHLISKQERLPFLRLARNRCATPSSTPTTTASGEKTPTNSFLISPDHSSSANPNSSHERDQQSSSLQQAVANKKYQNIVKKYRKKFLGAPQTPSSTSSLSNSMDKSSSLTGFDHSSASDEPPTIHHNLLTMNSIQSLLTNGSHKSCKQEKFKFPTLNDSYSTRTFAALKAANNSHNVKDQQQVNRHCRARGTLTPSRSLVPAEHASEVRTTPYRIPTAVRRHHSHAEFSHAANGALATQLRLHRRRME